MAKLLQNRQPRPINGQKTVLCQQFFTFPAFVCELSLAEYGCKGVWVYGVLFGPLNLFLGDLSR